MYVLLSVCATTMRAPPPTPPADAGAVGAAAPSLAAARPPSAAAPAPAAPHTQADAHIHSTWQYVCGRGQLRCVHPFDWFRLSCARIPFGFLIALMNA